jgi:hypothetical protein
VVTGIAKLLLQQSLKQGSKRFAQPLRGAYKSNSYFKDYVDMMTGQQGWKKGAAAWYGTDLAMDAVSDVAELGLPERVQEDTTIIEAKDLSPFLEEKKSPVDMPPEIIKEPKVIPLPDKKETSNKKILEEEENMKNDAISSNGTTAQTDQATVGATNNPESGGIDNESVDRVRAYKDIVRQFLGQGDEGMRMQKAAMLMQVGGMLMAGKSEDPGVKGFVDIVGQTAMQTAPMLFQMGVEQGKSEREIGQAALQMYMQDVEDQTKRTGDFVGVWANEYERGENGAIVYDQYTGAPKLKNRRLVGTYRANSDEMNYFFDENNSAGYPFYTFQPSSGTAAGMSGMSAPGDGSTVMITDAAKDSMIKSARYIGDTVNVMANEILPLMFQNPDLIGLKGGILRKFGPSAYFLSEVGNAFKAGWGANSIQQITDDQFVVNRSSRLGKYYESILPGSGAGNEADKATEADGGSTYGVLENQTYINGVGQTIDIGGELLPVFIDTQGKYGVKGGSYLTRGSVEKMLFDPRRGQLAIFETTLGLALARKRQPTGRMLADVLRRSFAESKSSDIFGDANDPRVVIGNYVKLYKELYEGMSSQLDKAGYIPNEGSRTNRDQQISSMFTVPGAENMANLYYNLRRNDPSYSTYSFDIPGPGIPSFSSFMGGNTAVVSADDQQTNQNTGNAFDYWMNLLDQ